MLVAAKVDMEQSDTELQLSATVIIQSDSRANIAALVYVAAFSPERIAAEERRIAPASVRAMSKRAGSVVVEVSSRNADYVSQPAGAVGLIEEETR